MPYFSLRNNVKLFRKIYLTITTLSSDQLLLTQIYGEHMRFTKQSNFFHFAVLCAAVFVSVIGVSAQKNGDEKLTAEAVLAKHLDSIGTAEARTAAQSVSIIGTSRATFFGRGGGVADGISVLASKPGKYMVAMKFNTPDYPFEKLGYDGSEFSVGFVRPGVRSNLGSFLRTNEGTFKNGLMSGALSTSWALLNFDPKTARIKYAGLKKVDGLRLHALEYDPKKGSDLDITLFFDSETFRHVRTEYRRVIAARQGANIDASAGQSETRYLFVETFADFAEENKLTLPHTYKLRLEILTGNGTTAYEWSMNLQKFAFNQAIDDKDFNVDAY
jgi:outer membrane lipoprotein-sorting protein